MPCPTFLSAQSDGDYTADEVEFIKAMDAYQRAKRRRFPAWSEVLSVVRALGYRKVAEPHDHASR
jgi:hypothetical protein